MNCEVTIAGSEIALNVRVKKMKIQKNLMKLLARFFFALLAGMIFIPRLHAQSAGREIENRYLLVFDTSSAMKKRLPAEELAVKQLFAITLNGQIHPGDTIGVWTFSKDLRTGQFPLEHWEPQDVLSFPVEVLSFVKNQHYSKTTRFDATMQLLNQVVLNSPRLTTVIFCDGEGEIKGTPYDDVINNIFKQNQSMMEKARQPFVIILRSQFGRYVNYSINPASSIRLPEFPPLPRPPVKPAPASPLPPPPPQPQSTPAPLIIIGNNVETNPPAPAPATPANPPVPTPQSSPAPASPAPRPVPQASPPPLSANPARETNAAPQAASQPAATNAVVSATEATIPPAARASVASAPPNRSSFRLLAAGVSVLMVAGASAFLIFRPRNRHSPSLITESLKKR